MGIGDGRLRAAIFFSLTAAVLVLIAVAWSVVGAAAREPYLRLAASTRELEASIASRAMAEGFRVVVEQSSIITTYSFSEYFQGKRSAESMRLLMDAQRLQLSGILIDSYLEASGRETFLSAGTGSAEARAEIAAAAPAAREWLSAHPSPYVEAFGRDRPFFIYFHPVMRDGAQAGLFASGVDLGPAIARYVAPLESHPGRRAYLLDYDHRILWSSNPGERGKPFVAAAWAEGNLSDQSFLIGDFAFHVVAADEAKALRAVILSGERLRDIVFFGGLAAIVAIAAMMLRLYVLEGKRKAHAEAESRLEGMVVQRERELAESDLKFETLFERASDAIVIMSVSGEILRCNPRTALAFACRAEELIGKRPLDLSPRMQGKRPSAEALAGFMQLGRDSFPEPISFEWRFARADGSEFDAEMTLSIIEAGGTRYVQTILRDVTDRKRELRLLEESLEEREVILRELHHRVKNNLQYIESLIGLQRDSASGEVDMALAKIQGRVSSLELAYLAAADRPETLIIDAPTYLRTICDEMRSSMVLEGRRLEVSLECDSLPLGLDAAVSLGLILRELLENAALHGYVPGAEGSATVSLVRAGREVVLTVRDLGSGPSEAWHEALGLSLARALAAQLSGTLRLSAAQPGFSALLRFPLA